MNDLSETYDLIHFWNRLKKIYVMVLFQRDLKNLVFCLGVATIINCSTFFWQTFLGIWLIRRKGRKAYGNILFQHCCIASVAMLMFGSGFHAMYCESWCHSLDTKRSTVGYPKCLIMLLNMLWCSFHSEGSLAFQEFQSA